MFDDPKFRAATWRADATTIWFGFWSLVFSGITAIISFVEGHGVAVSLLIVALVLPATFASLVLARFRPEIQAQIASYFGSGNRAPVAGPLVDPRVDAGSAIEAPVAASSESSANVETAEERQAKHDLIVFIVEYLLPACLAQDRLQHAVAYKAAGDSDLLKRVISAGLLCEPTLSGFKNTLRDLQVSASSNTLQTYNLEQLMGLLVDVRSHYRDFCLRTIGFIPRWAERSRYGVEKELGDWQTKHNYLVEGYNNLVMDARFGKIYRPGGDNSFGSRICDIEDYPSFT